MVRRTIASAVSKIGTPIARSGTVSKIGTPIARSGTPMDTKNESPLFITSGRTDSRNPRYIDPVSPRNTLAGWKL